MFREYHYIDLPMTWSDARDYCREKYTDLVTIRDMGDISKLNRNGMDSGHVWIGLSDDPQSWGKGAVSKDFNSWRWSATAHIADYHNWGLGEPNNAYANELCVNVGLFGTWNDDNCVTKHKCICYSGKKCK